MTAVIILISPLLAEAQVSFDGGSINVTVSASVNHGSTPGVDDSDSDSRTITISPGFNNDFTGDVQVEASYSGPGIPFSRAIARASASLSATDHAAGPSLQWRAGINPVVSDFFSDADDVDAVCNVSGQLNFSVSGSPVMMLIGTYDHNMTVPEGSVGAASGEFGVSPLTPNPLSTLSINSVSTVRGDIEVESFLLNPGSYTFSGTLGTVAVGKRTKAGLRGSLSAIQTVTFAFRALAEQVFWSTGDGAFEDAGNWEPQVLPGPLRSLSLTAPGRAPLPCRIPWWGGSFWGGETTASTVPR